MPIVVKTFTETEDFIVPADVFELTTAEVTGPGQNGLDAVIIPGTPAGSDADNTVFGGEGTTDSIAPGQPGFFVTGNESDFPNNVQGPASFDFGPTEDSADVTLYAGGGNGAFASGGGPGLLRCTIPAGSSGTVNVGGPGQNSTITIDDDTNIAYAGGNADGDTPGEGGSTNTPGISGGEVVGVDGSPGTVGVRIGGGGGLGGEWNQVSNVVVEPGKIIRCTILEDITSLIYDPDGINGDILSYHISEDTTHEYGGELTGSHFGGPGAESGGPTYGGGGGCAGTPDFDGVGGDVSDGGINAETGNHGGDGGNIESVPARPDGANGLLPGDGGGGPLPVVGSNRGFGRPGLAVIRYEVAEETGNESPIVHSPSFSLDDVALPFYHHYRNRGF